MSAVSRVMPVETVPFAVIRIYGVIVSIAAIRANRPLAYSQEGITCVDATSTLAKTRQERRLKVTDYLLTFSGALFGLIVGIPCGIGLSGHRHLVAGVPVRSENWFVVLVSRPPKNFPIGGRIAFVAVMLCWLCIFFGAILAPAIVARFIGLPDDSPIIGNALLVELIVGFFSVWAGHFIWNRMAY